MNITPQKFYCTGNLYYPNSPLPALLYKGALNIPFLFPAKHVKTLFYRNNWFNAWDSGIFTYTHYHSITHEVLGIYKGSTLLLLGGENGQHIKIQKGDVLIIPAGVAHKNLGDEHAVKCIGAYPDGRDYDIMKGSPGERPQADLNIAQVPIPGEDPLFGTNDGVAEIWTSEPRAREWLWRQTF